MYRKARRNFIIMAFVVTRAMIAATTAAIYFSTSAIIRDRSQDRLSLFTEEYFDQGIDTHPMHRCYLVAYDSKGNIIQVIRPYRSHWSRGEITALSNKILKYNQSEGTDGDYYYMRTAKDNRTVVAMRNEEITRDGFLILIRNTLLVTLAAAAVLLLITIFWSARVIRPLIENDRKQRDFISYAGHELKTPVTSIIVNATVLSREIGENKWLMNIQNECSHMSVLINQLLTLEHLHSRQKTEETAELDTLLNDTCSSFEARFQERGMELRSSVQTGLSVRGNPDDLRELCSILFDNALSHGVPGTPVTVTLNRASHKAVLNISNMFYPPEEDPDDVSRFFDRFYRADKARQRSGNHYGLGLSIARSITDLYHGEISAEAEGNRIRFTVSLPLLQRTQGK